MIKWGSFVISVRRDKINEESNNCGQRICLSHFHIIPNIVTHRANLYYSFNHGNHLHSFQDLSKQRINYYSAPKIIMRQSANMIVQNEVSPGQAFYIFLNWKS